MTDFPMGMKAEIEAKADLSGEADTVFRDLRRLRETNTELSISLTALVFRPGPRHRYQEPFALPAIRDGDGEAAKSMLDQLVRQSRVTPDMEHRLDHLIAEAERLTRR